MNEKKIESLASDDAQPNQLLRGLHALLGYQVNVIKQNVLIIGGNLDLNGSTFAVGYLTTYGLNFTASNVREIRLLPDRPAIIEVF